MSDYFDFQEETMDGKNVIRCYLDGSVGVISLPSVKWKFDAKTGRVLIQTARSERWLPCEPATEAYKRHVAGGIVT